MPMTKHSHRRIKPFIQGQNDASSITNTVYRVRRGYIFCIVIFDRLFLEREGLGGGPFVLQKRDDVSGGKVLMFGWRLVVVGIGSEWYVAGGA
jgi:hypothetical protein